MKPSSLWSFMGGMFVAASVVCTFKYLQWQLWPKPKGTPGIIEAAFIFFALGIVFVAAAASAKSEGR